MSDIRSLFISVTLALLTATAAAQAPSVATPPRVPPAPKPAGTLAQLMRGIYFPNSNLIFDVQQNDPGAPKKKTESSGSSTDTYSGAYGGWEVVENAAIALTDGVDLILKSGRTCQNGKPVPINQPDFQKFARDARRRTRRVRGGPDQQSGKGVRRHEQHRRRLFELSRGLSRQGTSRQPGALYAAAQEIMSR